MATTETLNTEKALYGFIKIWQTDPTTGESSLIVDKPNLILRGGARLIARALGGDPAAKIWGMYIGYNNTSGFTPKSITVDYADPFSGFNAPFGYLREPLTFTPTYLSSTGYDENTVLFSTMVTTATRAGGADFNTDSRIYEVALVSTKDSDNALRDTVFARTNFNAVQYNPNYNFTITWGVRILVA